MSLTAECPYPGCGFEGPPRKSREQLRAKAVWLCESCGGILPIVVRPRRKRRRSWDEIRDEQKWKGHR